MWNRGTFQSETFLRNLGEPGSRFRVAAPNHPEALLEEPQVFQVVGEKQTSGAPLIATANDHPTQKPKTPRRLKYDDDDKTIGL